MQTLFVATLGLQGNTEYRKASRQEVMESAALYNQTAILGTDALTNAHAAREYLVKQYSGYEHEVFGVLFLDTRNRVIASEIMFRGTIDGAAVHRREVAKRCLEHNAAAVIIFHNHPSGIVTESQCDLLITQNLKEALTVIDVRIIDHIIVGGGTFNSFAERGLL